MFSLNLLLTNLIPLCDRVNRTLSSHSSSSQMPQLGAPQRSAQIFAHVAILKIKSSVKIQSAPDLGKVIRVSLIFWKSSATQHEDRRVQASGVSKRTHAPVTGLHREPKLEGRRGILEVWGWLAENVRHNTSAPYRHSRQMSDAAW